MRCVIHVAISMMALCTLTVRAAIESKSNIANDVLHLVDTDVNPIYDAHAYAQVVRNIENGTLYAIQSPDDLAIEPFKVLHVFGDAYARGYAHGVLLANELSYFLDEALPEFYRSEVEQIPLDSLPSWLRSLIESVVEKPLEDIAPAVFETALGFVYDMQKKHIEASPTDVWTEADGIAEGLCAAKGCEASQLEAYKKKVRHVNMLPELIRMQCSMMGAFGKATGDGKLIQLRTLDFGEGPFANATFLSISHPPEGDGFAFASVSFPGFVGAVTGFSEKIGQCEKVDDVTGGKRPRGTYDGQAVSMVIRDMLQLASSKEDAIAIAERAKRTWSVWLGIGDQSSQAFNAILYDKAEALALNDTSLPPLTNQTYFPDVVYIDKHPQPSPHTTMPSLVKRFYGTMTSVSVAQNFPRLMQSGDVHVALYDMGAGRAYISRGTTFANGSFLRNAYEAPFLAFDMEALWTEQRKSAYENDEI